MDGRFILRSADFLARYLRVLDQPEHFNTYCRQYAITHALLPVARGQRYARLARYLYGQPDWHLLYLDGADAVFSSDFDHTEEGLDLRENATIDKIRDVILKTYEQNIYLQNRQPAVWLISWRI